MSDDHSKDLNTGEAKIGRFLLRMALAVAWAGVAWGVYFNSEQFEISDTMRILLAGVASVMAVISFIQALGNYGPENQASTENTSEKDDSDG